MATDTLEHGLRYSRDVVVSLFCFVLAIFWIKYFRDKLKTALSIVVIILFSVALLQFTYESFGFGLDPNLADEFYVHAKSAYEIGYPSTFGNPNNFAAFILPIFILLILEKKNAWNVFVIVICAISLLLAGSRMALIGAVVGLLFWPGRLKVAIIALLLVAFAFLGAIYNKGIETDIYAIDRAFTAFRIAPSGLSTDSSIGLRVLSHQMFLNNFGEFVVGSFSPSYMCPQLSSFSYNSNLLIYNPHSFIIEMHCLFGLAGTVILTLFIVAISIFYFENKTNKSKIILTFLICMIVITIPSGIFRSSQLFFSLTLFIISVAAGWERRLGGKSVHSAAAKLPLPSPKRF